MTPDQNTLTSKAQGEILQGLLALSHELGKEALGLAILGEGNTSANCGDGTFLVKASGSQLSTLHAADVSRVHFGPMLALLERESVADEALEAELRAALVDAGQKKPSVETFLHALCLWEGNASWVGHTHAVAVNRILCSKLGAEPFLQHLFPDAVVVCGRAPAVVPYVDPGFALAKAVQQELRRYKQAFGQPPKLLLLVNHGLVALGQTAKEVMNITLMADKWASILWGSYALGGPRFLPEAEVARIDSRLDEHYRRKLLREGQ